MTNELKPCPFCGGKAKLRIKNRTVIQSENKRNCYVYCLECDARGKRFLEGNTTEQRQQARKLAVEHWNNRQEGE